MSPAITIRLLGYAGLIPFVLPVAWLALGGEAYPWLATLVGVYALGIICFLTGSWWGLGLAGPASAAFWISNAVFLVAVTLFALLPSGWPLAAALLLLAIFALERVDGLVPATPGDYRTMRLRLTLVAGASMLGLPWAG